jgi:hypothetical protein
MQDAAVAVAFVVTAQSTGSAVESLKVAAGKKEDRQIRQTS